MQTILIALLFFPSFVGALSIVAYTAWRYGGAVASLSIPANRRRSLVLPCSGPALQPDPVGAVRAVPGAEQHLQRSRSLGGGPAADPRLPVGRLDLPPRHQERSLLLFPGSHSYVSARTAHFPVHEAVNV